MTEGVLVVGGGVAGSALLRALSLRGVTATLFERRAATPARGMGLNLPANALRALAALGLADEVERRGRQIRRREYRNAAGRLLFGVDEEAFWGAVGPSVCVRRGDLLDLLQGAPTTTRPRWNTAVSHVEPGPAGVRVHLDAGGSETYALVVGADGVHSAVRPAVGGQRAARPSAMTGASWRFMTANPGVDCWTVWSGAAGTFLLIPVDGHEVYGYASTTRGGAAGAEPGWLADTFSGFAAPVPAVVAALANHPEQMAYSPVEEVRAERWSEGRVVLVGDAAHATGPVWAQGAALAMEDALVLADLLASLSDWSDAGAELERIRRPRVEHVQAATDRMTRLAGLPSLLRDVVAPVLGPKAYRAAYGPLRTPISPAGATH